MVQYLRLAVISMILTVMPLVIYGQSAAQEYAEAARQYFTAILPFVYDLRPWPRLLCGS